MDRLPKGYTITVFVILICVGSAVWYYNPGFTLPKLKEPSIKNAKILEGRPITDPRYRQMCEVKNDLRNLLPQIAREMGIYTIGRYVDNKDNAIVIEIRNHISFLKEREFKKIVGVQGKELHLDQLKPGQV
ncbi:MAG: hypothetical protein FH756_18860 [Firmicutes bacterium]|nr:hypothetical protein [Bacillota bacterium]